jgi:hypothetical protein
MAGTVKPTYDHPSDAGEWRDAQVKDDNLQKNKVGPRKTKSQLKKKGYKISADNLLIRMLKNGNQTIVVPSILRKPILSAHHDHVLSGHLGIKKTSKRIKHQYSWKGMKKDITDYVQGCKVCQRVKPRNKGPYGLMDSRTHTHPGQSVSCDLIGPLPKSPDGYEHALLILDDFTKNFEIYPLRSVTAKAVAERMVDYCCRYGFPEAIRSDNGRQFASTVWNDTCNILGIKPRKTSPYRPSKNTTERLNRTVKQCIKMHCKKHKLWAQYLPAASFALRTAENETTKHTPANLTYGRELRSRFAATAAINLTPGSTVDDYAQTLHEEMSRTYAEVRECVAAKKVQYGEQYNSKRISSPFRTADLVFRRNQVISCAKNGVASSLAPSYVGPFRLTKQLGNNVFDLETLQGKPAGSRYVDQLKPFRQRPEWACSESSTSSSDKDEEEFFDAEDSLPAPTLPTRRIKQPQSLQDFVCYYITNPRPFSFFRKPTSAHGGQRTSSQQLQRRREELEERNLHKRRADLQQRAQTIARSLSRPTPTASRPAVPKPRPGQSRSPFAVAPADAVTPTIVRPFTARPRPASNVLDLSNRPSTSGQTHNPSQRCAPQSSVRRQPTPPRVHTAERDQAAAARRQTIPPIIDLDDRECEMWAEQQFAEAAQAPASAPSTLEPN